MYHNIKFFIIGMTCVGFGIFLYQFDIFDTSLQNNISNENIQGNNDVDIQQEEKQESEIIKQSENISKVESDLEKQDFGENIKNEKYFSDFEYTLVKFPEIIEYPDLLQDFLDFKENNKNILPTNIDLTAYQGLLEKLIKNNLLLEIGENNFGSNNWKKYAIFGNKNYIKIDSQNNCGLNEGFGACFTVVTQQNKKQKYIYGDTGILEIYSHENKNYILSEKSFGSGCGAISNYILYDFSGLFLNKVSELTSGCDKVTKHGLRKSNQSIEFVQSTLNRNDYQEKIFSSIEISQDFDIKENILYMTGSYDFDIYENLFNGEFIDVKINGENKRFSIKEYPEDQKISYTYQDNIMLKLLKNEIGYTIEGTFLREKSIDTISVKNCKQNNSELLDEYYTLNKYKIGDEKFQYNISKKYGNYCEEGSYIFRFKGNNNIQHITEIKLNFED